MPRGGNTAGPLAAAKDMLAQASVRAVVVVHVLRSSVSADAERRCCNSVLPDVVTFVQLAFSVSVPPAELRTPPLKTITLAAVSIDPLAAQW